LFVNICELIVVTYFVDFTMQQQSNVLIMCIHDVLAKKAKTDKLRTNILYCRMCIDIYYCILNNVHYFETEMSGLLAIYM